jgi:mono/diheme cytochrome c family protein
VRPVNVISNFIRILLTSFIFLNQAESQTNTWIAPTANINIVNPISGDPNSIKTGKTLYSTYCTPCHGDRGKGDGIASAGLNPKPANHTSAAVQSETDGSLFYKISEGRNAMPQYKLTLTEAQRWSLVNYIRTLAKKS